MLKTFISSSFLSSKLVLPKHLFILVRLALMIAVFFFCRMAFYFYNIDLFPDLTFSELSRIFYGGVRFDFTGVLYLNIFYFIFILLPFRFVYSEKYQFVLDKIFVLINLIEVATNCIDMVYYPFTLKRTTGAIFKIFEHEKGLFSIFFNGLFDFWEASLLFVCLAFVIIQISRKIKLRVSKLKPLYFYTLHTVLMPLFLFAFITAIRGGFGLYTRPISINHAGQYVKSPRYMALVLNTPFSILRTLRQKVFKRKHDFADDKLDKIFTPVKEIISTTKGNKKNVIILVLESFGREHSRKLNPKLENGTYKGFTPFLDSLMNHSLYFTNAYANGRKSIDALPAVITGIPTIDMHFVISNYSTNRVSGIGHILKKNGYDNAFFHGAPNGSMGFNSFMNLAGVAKYFGFNEYNNSDDYDGAWGIWDEEFLQFMAKNISKLQEPFFVTFFSISSHHPFDVPERYEGKFPVGGDPIVELVGYTDYALRRFFETASKQSWFQNTIFAITADHAGAPYHDEYRNNIGGRAIPIIFYTPDSSLVGVDRRVAQQVDIFPTILDYLNISTKYFSFGSSLLNPENRNFSVSSVGAFTQTIMDSLVYHFFQEKGNALYDYVKDPYLKKNILTKQNSRIDTLTRAIRQQFYNRMIDNRLTPDEE